MPAPVVPCDGTSTGASTGGIGGDVSPGDRDAQTPAMLGINSPLWTSYQASTSMPYRPRAAVTALVDSTTTPRIPAETAPSTFSTESSKKSTSDA